MIDQDEAGREAGLRSRVGVMAKDIAAIVKKQSTQKYA